MGAAPIKCCSGDVAACKNDADCFDATLLTQGDKITKPKPAGVAAQISEAATTTESLWQLQHQQGGVVVESCEVAPLSEAIDPTNIIEGATLNVPPSDAFVTKTVGETEALVGKKVDSDGCVFSMTGDGSSLGQELGCDAAKQPINGPAKPRRKSSKENIAPVAKVEAKPRRKSSKENITPINPVATVKAQSDGMANPQTERSASVFFPVLYKGCVSHPVFGDEDIEFELELTSTSQGRWGSGDGVVKVTGVIDDLMFDFSDGMTVLKGEVHGDKIEGEVSQEGTGGGKFSITRMPPGHDQVSCDAVKQEVEPDS